MHFPRKISSCACLAGSRLEFVFHWNEDGVSSANNLEFDAKFSDKSLKYIKNISGPRIEPSETPSSKRKTDRLI